jgi:hypothetical protein
MTNTRERENLDKRVSERVKIREKGFLSSRDGRIGDGNSKRGKKNKSFFFVWIEKINNP